MQTSFNHYNNTNINQVPSSSNIIYQSHYNKSDNIQVPTSSNIQYHGHSIPQRSMHYQNNSQNISSVPLRCHSCHCPIDKVSNDHQNTKNDKDLLHLDYSHRNGSTAHQRKYLSTLKVVSRIFTSVISLAKRRHSLDDSAPNFDYHLDEQIRVMDGIDRENITKKNSNRELDQRNQFDKLDKFRETDFSKNKRHSFPNFLGKSKKHKPNSMMSKSDFTNLNNAIPKEKIVNKNPFPSQSTPESGIYEELIKPDFIIENKNKNQLKNRRSLENDISIYISDEIYV